jgi:two-component system sensor histidine kinase PilS (NtrC family)
VKDEIAGPFRWVSLFRVTSITVVLGLGIYFLRKNPLPFSVIPLWIVIATTYVLTFTYWIWLKSQKFTNIVLWASIVADVFLITSIVHYTGGIESRFVFLYLFPILEGSIFFLFRGGIVAATLCLLAYGSTLQFEFHKLIAPVFAASSPDLSTLYARLYLQATYVYLIALTSGYLAARIRQKGEALEQVKLDTSTILHSIESGLLVFDHRGNVLHKNKKAEEILASTVGNRIEDFSSETKEWIEGLLEEGFQETQLSSRIIGIHTSKLRDTRGEDRGVVLVLDDLTDSKIKERLITIGEFSGDLAHEVRNPLAAIQGSCELIKEGVDREEEKSLVENILSHTVRLNDVVTSFLSFTKPIYPDLKPAEIGEVVDEAIRLAPGQAEVSTEKRTHGLARMPIEVVRPEPLWVKLDREQMKTVFLNIIVNAYDAANSSTRLRIDITPPLHAYSFLGDKKTAADNEVVVSFTDTGKGIPDSDVPKLFTPFYTTKKGGVGLGLSIVSRIVEKHRGRIEAKSRTGEGTVLAVHLPYNG